MRLTGIGMVEGLRPPQSTHTLDFVSHSVRGGVLDNRTRWGLITLLQVPFPCPGIQAMLSGDLLWRPSTQIVARATEKWISNCVVWTDLIYPATRGHCHLLTLEKADPGPQQKSEWGLESATLTYFSSTTRRHQEQGKRRGQSLLSHTKTHSHGHPANMKLVIPFYSLKKYIHLFS